MKAKIGFISGVLFVLASLMTVGCDKGPKANSAANNGAGVCAVGQVYIATYNGCFSTAQCAAYGPNYGYVPQVNQCMPGVIGGGVVPGHTTNPWWGGDLYISNPSHYRALIKALRFCGGGWLNGVLGASCDDMDSRGYLALQVYGNGTLPAHGNAVLYVYHDYNYTYRTVSFSNPINLAHQSTAFELSSWGYNEAYNKVITFEGNVGTLTNGNGLVPSYRLRLFYDGTEVGFSDVSLQY